MKNIFEKDWDDNQDVVGNLDIDLSLDEKPVDKPKKHTLEKECKKEIGESLKKIRENEKKFREMIDVDTDTNFYFQVVFRSPKEMKQFLQDKKIELQYGDYIFVEDIKDKFK